MPLLKTLLLWSALSVGWAAPPDATHADQVVAQLRDTLSPMPLDPDCATGLAAPDRFRGPGFICPTAKDRELRASIYEAILGMGRPGVLALGRAISNPDIRVRRGATLALEWLGNGYDAHYPKMDLEPALPALMEGLSDPDDLVRSWSAQAIGSVGAPGLSAVPLLIHMLSSTDEGDRNGACIALGGIGPVARAALPALSLALKDPSHNVRGFALRAMAAIESARR